MKSTEQALSEALNAGVSRTLGDLQFQVIALTAERDVLKAENAALTTKVAALEVYGKEAKAAYDALTRDDARPPAPEVAVRRDSPWLDRIEAVAASEGVAP